MIRLGAIFLLPSFGGILLALSGDAELQPRPVMISGTDLALDQALAQLHKQTGNLVNDRRATPVNPKLKPPARTGTFWPVLDAICKETRIGISTYEADGGVALVDAPYRELKTHYSGLFRFVVKRIVVSKDEETHAHLCHITLDTAWEPRFKALYLNLNGASASAGPWRAAIDRDAAEPVSGKGAAEIVLRMKAPDRAVAKIESLTGSIRVVGIPRMLEFAVPKLVKDKVVEQDGVKVRLTQVNTKSATRWSVELAVAYPEGAIVPLESFQTWRDSNRVWLAWTDPKTKKTLELEPSSGGGAQDTETGTKIQFNFTPRGDTPLPAANADVTLHYRTPSRVVAVTVPFEFRDLPLP